MSLRTFKEDKFLKRVEEAFRHYQELFNRKIPHAEKVFWNDKMRFMFLLGLYRSEKDTNYDVMTRLIEKKKEKKKKR